MNVMDGKQYTYPNLMTKIDMMFDNDVKTDTVYILMSLLITTTHNQVFAKLLSLTFKGIAKLIVSFVQ